MKRIEDIIVEKISTTITEETRDLSRDEYRQVLEDLCFDLQARLDGLDTDDDNEE